MLHSSKKTKNLYFHYYFAIFFCDGDFVYNVLVPVLVHIRVFVVCFFFQESSIVNICYLSRTEHVLV